MRKTPTRKKTVFNRKPKPGIDFPFPKLAYSIEETAACLGYSYITTFRLLKRGLLKSSSACRHRIIPHTEIERFLKATTA